MGYDLRIEHEGSTFGVSYEADIDSGAPWENDDGHGPVSDWRSYSMRHGYSPKKPGERPLCSDNGSARFYDMAQAQLIARKDGWGYGGKSVAEWQATGLTLKQIAANAALSDYQRLRGWCNDDWSYIGVVVTLLDDEGEDTPFSDSVWCVESDGDYEEEVAHQLAGEIMSQIVKASGKEY